MKTNGTILSAFALALGGLLILGPNRALADKTDPSVMTSVDLQRYAGLWHEIAHAPNFFQRSCLRSTAEYAVTSPTSLSVKNVCYKAGHDTSSIEGTARIVDESQPAKLKVRFNFFARGDYWIVDLDPDYQWAIVSGPRKKSLFILSRTAPMEPALLASLLAKLKEKGFNTDELIFDQH